MKVKLSTRKGDFTVELSTAHERLTFSSSAAGVISDRDFISATLVEDEGEAKFASLSGLIKALNSYES